LICVYKKTAAVLTNLYPDFFRISSSKEYDKEKYLEMLLDSAEAVLSIFGFNRSLFGFDKKMQHWWDEIYHQRERDIKAAKTEL
jgi:hypothetical protein